MVLGLTRHTVFNMLISRLLVIRHIMLLLRHRRLRTQHLTTRTRRMYVTVHTRQTSNVHRRLTITQHRHVLHLARGHAVLLNLHIMGQRRRVHTMRHHHVRKAIRQVKGRRQVNADLLRRLLRGLLLHNDRLLIQPHVIGHRVHVSNVQRNKAGDVTRLTKGNRHHGRGGHGSFHSIQRATNARRCSNNRSSRQRRTRQGRNGQSNFNTVPNNNRSIKRPTDRHNQTSMSRASRRRNRRGNSHITTRLQNIKA